MARWCRNNFAPRVRFRIAYPIENSGFLHWNGIFERGVSLCLPCHSLVMHELSWNSLVRRVVVRTNGISGPPFSERL